MLDSLLDFQYDEYFLITKEKSILMHGMDIINNLRDESRQYNTMAYMIPNTEVQSESDIWRANRWFRITASTAKVANSLDNILNTETQYCDSSKRKLSNFIDIMFVHVP